MKYLATEILRHASRRPDCIAIVDQGGERRTTWRELHALSCKIAAQAKAENLSGVAPIVQGRTMEYIATWLGLNLAGAGVAPLTDAYPQARIDYIRGDLGASAVADDAFVARAKRNAAEDFIPQGDAADIAMVTYTSGSTGNPKGVMYDADTLRCSMARLAAAFCYGTDAVSMHSVPMSFIASLDVYAVLMCGGCVHILPEETRRDAVALINYAQRHQVTNAFLPPQMLRQIHRKLPSIRAIMAGGEKLSGVSGELNPVINGYGLSETAGLALFFHVDKAWDNTPIGKPGPGMQVYLVDENGCLADEGEICLSGAIARGYWNRPEETAKAFTPNPYSDAPGHGVLLHTGDLGRRLPDGNLLYLNRLDWMLKINGQRVEPGEIEEQFKQIDGVTQAVVKGFENAYGQTYLCAWYTADRDVAETEIRRELALRLASYMMPAFILRLDAFPLNANGKLDRKALAAPDAALFKCAYEAPVDETEAALCRAYEELLGVEQVGRNDDFFALGGDSIQAVRLCAKLDDRIASADVFAGRTPCHIARLARQKESAGKIAFVATGDTYPLTAGQTGVYFACMNAPDSLMYNIPVACRLPADTDVSRLAEAIRRVIGHYAAFGVRFEVRDGQVRMAPQAAQAAVAVTEAADIDRRKVDFVRPFDLAQGQLARFEIVRTADAPWLLMDTHHIISDGTSAGVILQAIAAAYEGRDLPDEPVSLFAAACAEEALQGTAEYEQAHEFFAYRLAEELDGFLLPDDSANENVPYGDAAHCEFRFDDTVRVHDLELFARKNGVTEATVFLGAFAFAMTKALGGQGCRFCTVNNGRHYAELAQTVGMLVRTLPLAVHLNEDDDAAKYLKELQTLFFATMGNDSYPFSKLAQEFGVSNETMFVYQAESLNGFELAGQHVPMQMIDSPHALSMLTMHVFKADGGYRASVQYRCDLYQERTIRMLVKLMKLALTGFIGGARLRDIPLTDAADAALLNSFHGEGSDAPRLSVVDMIRAQCRKTPDNIAIVSGKTRITYRELDEVTDRLAAHLVKQGIGREDVVAVLSDRNEMMAVCPIAIAKSGAMYQPLDSTYPTDRLTFMVQDSSAKLLIAPRELRHLVQEDVPTCFAEDIAALPACDIALPTPAAEDAFVILYTSGSTGLPKGCILEHGNLAAYLRYYIARYGMTADSRTAAYASFGFDANMMDLYTPLCVGAQLHVIPVDMRLDFARLNAYMEANGITHAFFTTQVGRQFATTMKNHSLKYLLVGGESLTPCEPPENYTLVNIYGPTECTIAVTDFDVDRLYASVPIGDANTEVELYIVDRHFRRVPVGVPGELCIAGPQVSRGYLNRPEKTAEVFIRNPFTDRADYQRMYRTGDVVRFLPDGNIQFIGRRDSQVKIRGFRIELSEVERVIREFDGISNATVVAKDAPGGGKMLWAYVVGEKQIDIAALNRFILERKPPYMAPAAMMQIDRIPLTQNMKVDRRRLPEIKMTRATGESRALTRLEKDIIEVVAALTGTADIPVAEPLTLFGISSISAIALAAKLEERFGVLIDVKLLLADSSVLDVENAITALLLDAHRVSAQTAEMGKPLSVKHLLTQTQLGIYLECLKAGDSDVYNVPMLWQFAPAIDVNRLKNAVEAALRAHPALHCAIRQDADGDVYMYPGDAADCAVPVVRTSEDALMDEVAARRVRFDLSKGPLYFAAILQTERCCYLLLEAHHIVADGTSLSILLADIDRVYGGAAAQAERLTQFAIADAEAENRKTTALADAKAHYEALLSGVESSPAPAGDLASEGTAKGAFYTAELPLSAKDVAAYVQANNVTENAFFTTAFAITLAKYTARNDALFTTIFHGRTDLRMADTVGMLVKTLPVCAKFNVQDDVPSLVAAMKEQLMRSMAADLYSFAEISRAYDLNADVMFVYQGDILQAQTVGNQPVSAIPLELNGLKSTFSAELHRHDGGYRFLLEYDASRYSESYAALFADAFCTAAQEMLVRRAFGDVGILSKGSAALVTRLNDTAAEVPSMPAYRLMERSAEQYPDRIACIANGERLTYAQLNASANRVAHHLMAEGAAVNEIVALLLERTNLVYMAREGILKSGAAFMSLDPEYPDERIAFILENSGCRLLLTTRAIHAKRGELLKQSNVRILFMEDLIHDGRDDNPSLSVPDDALAYCIYTSGSTGTPKGVLLNQRNLVNFATINDKNYEVRNYVQGNRVSLALASVSFDVSIMEEFIPFGSGMTVCMATEEEIHDAARFFALLSANQVDAMCCTPSFLANIIDLPGAAEALANVKTYDLGAEAYLPALTGRIHAINPDALIVNGYGPTEATISCTSTVIREDERITIGVPNANVEAYVVDQQGHVLPPCAIGELVLTGEGVGMGYLKLPDRTSKAFITLETPSGTQRAYRSGDSVMQLPDGRIVFFGRLDDQVKLRGLRIELGEVQSVLSSFAGVRNCVVLVEGEGMSAFLAAWYTADHEIDKAELTDYMASRLARYMVPTALMQLDAIPMTANQKVDKKRLPHPEQQKVAAALEKPRTPAEADYCRIMAEALGVSEFGATDNFFESGGTSLTASRVLMQANVLGYAITYSDIFSEPTPRALAALDQDDEAVSAADTPDIDREIVNYDYSAIHRMLEENTLEAVRNGERRELGNVCITGAAGFLGIHILKEFLDRHSGRAYCILRGKGRMKAETRLRSMLVYYFSDGMDALFGDRIIVVDGDITQKTLFDTLMQFPIDTYINCAANVKHFSAGTDIEDINVGGVALGTDFAMKKGCRFIQISTVSVGGMSVDHVPDENIRLDERMLYFGQDLSNKYVHSKFLAERIVLEKALCGLDAKIIRVGNLMARASDGEFQANFLTNNFLKTLKAFSIIGCMPYELLDADCEFAPIDVTASAVLTLAALPAACRVFHAYNNHMVHMSDVLGALSDCGIHITPCEAEEYDRAYASALEKSEHFASLNALTAYRERGRETVMIDATNAFTSQVLYRQNFRWPLVSPDYLKNFFNMMIQLGYFDRV